MIFIYIIITTENLYDIELQASNRMHATSICQKSTQSENNNNIMKIISNGINPLQILGVKTPNVGQNSKVVFSDDTDTRHWQAASLHMNTVHPFLFQSYKTTIEQCTVMSGDLWCNIWQVILHGDNISTKY